MSQPTHHYLWSSEGDPNRPPGRLVTITCPKCGGLVDREYLPLHRELHRLLGDQADQEEGTTR